MNEPRLAALGPAPRAEAVKVEGCVIDREVVPSPDSHEHRGDDVPHRARDAGFSEHLTKPINFERLEEAIQSLLTAEPEAKSTSGPVTPRNRRSRTFDLSEAALALQRRPLKSKESMRRRKPFSLIAA